MDYDAIVITGSAMEWNPKMRCWEFPMVIEKSAGKLVMGEAKAMAAKEVEGLARKILVTGGSDPHPETGIKVSRSEEMASLIRERYGVDSSKVVSIGNIDASYTLANVDSLVSYLGENPEIIESGRLAILCPRFKLERTKLLFGSDSYFGYRGLSLDWLVVEDILEAKDPENKTWIDGIYNSPNGEICREMEKKGIEDFLSGKYKRGVK